MLLRAPLAPILLLACATVVACDVDTGAGPDAGSEDTADAGTPEDVRCPDDATLLPLAVLQEPLVLGHATGLACPVVPAGFLVRNTGDDSVLIDAVAVGLDGASVASLPLPAALAPGHSLRVPLLFDAPAADDATGRLVLAGPDGCSAFAVRGLRVDGAAATSSHDVLDLGALAPGADGQGTLTITQRAAAGASASHGSFVATPPFQVEAADVVLDGCDSLSVTVRLTAPDAPGIVGGELRYEVEAGGFHATAAVPLRATVVP